MNDESTRSLNRKVKRYIHRTNHEYYAVVTPGFEKVARKEIQELPGAEVHGTEKGGVSFSGSDDLIYLSHHLLRTPVRILLRIASFQCHSYPELYDRCKRIPWDIYTGSSAEPIMHATSVNSRLHHKGRIEETVLAAWRSPHPHVQGSEKTARIEIRFFRDLCTLSLDLTGDPLFRRGFRSEVGAAPLRENIAASLLMSLDLNRYDTIIDPFCGSGVFLVEAISLLSHTLPGGERKYLYQHLPLYRSGHEQHLVKKESENRKTLAQEKKNQEKPGGVSTLLVGADYDGDCIEKCHNNLERFQKVRSANLDHWLLVSNLPYGKRIERRSKTWSVFFHQVTDLIFKLPGEGTFLLLMDRNHEKLFLRAFGNRGVVKEKVRFRNGGIQVVAITGTNR